MIHRAGFVFVVAAVWASLVAPAGAQAPRLCDGVVATIVGTPGDDVLTGTAGVDVIAGLQGNDIINGLGGDDIICGGIGNDLLIGGEGFDIIFGAQGNDEIYSAGTGSLFLPRVLEDVRGARIFAGAGNDIVYGSDRWDRMQGGDGDDLLYGFAGNDWMRGGAGNDVVIGHNGSDDLYGGGGLDLVSGDRRDSSVRAGAGNDSCPDVPNTNFRGCTFLYPVDANDSTLPAFGVPDQLAGGVANTYVWVASQDGEVVFVSFSGDVEVAAMDPRFDGIVEVTLLPVTNGQARAISQAILDVQLPFFINTTDMINRDAPFYDEAVAWGNDWLAINGYINE